MINRHRSSASFVRCGLISGPRICSSSCRSLRRATSSTAGDWLSAVAMFLAFSLTASGIYLVNDLADLQADRHHSRKRKRPFASGDLSLHVGVLSAPLLVLAGCVIAAALGSAWVIILYAALSISYSFRLKQEPLIDIFVLATLYTLRLFAGGEATSHPLSYWLLAFSGFFFLGLALVKRLSELMASDVDQIPRRGYRRRRSRHRAADERWCWVSSPA